MLCAEFSPFCCFFSFHGRKGSGFGSFSFGDFSFHGRKGSGSFRFRGRKGSGFLSGRCCVALRHSRTL